MIISIIGFSSHRIDQTLVNALAAASEFEEMPDVQWINDTHGIAEMARTAPPTVMLNGRLRSMGRVPSVYEFTSWIREEIEEPLVA
jgi:hypothetical protein